MKNECDHTCPCQGGPNNSDGFAGVACVVAIMLLILLLFPW